MATGAKYTTMTPPRFPGLAALLLAATVALVPASARADALQEADSLFRQGQLGTALEKAERILALKPHDARARFLKGLILTQMNRRNDAIAVFAKLTEDFPELPEPYNNLAVLYAQQNQFDKAKEVLEMAIRAHPSYAMAHENLGDIYARMAGQAYDKALQFDSSSTGARTKRALIRDLMSFSSQQTRPDARVPAGNSQAAARPEPATLAAQTAAEAKSASAPTTDASSADRQTAAGGLEAEKAVRDWAAAWSRKDINAYLASYAEDFQAPGGEARDTWAAKRAQRLRKPGVIQVRLENLQVTADGPDRATARFRQHYRSGSLKTTSEKTLVLVKREGKWLIQQQRVGN